MTFSRRFTFDPLRNLQREFDRALGTIGFATPADTRHTFPALNVWEDSDRLFVEAELPGFSMEQLEVLVDGRELSLKGRRDLPDNSEQTWHRRERIAGEFARFVTLPIEVDAERVEASLKDGVLTIVLPKHERAKARKISVKTA